MITARFAKANVYTLLGMKEEALQTIEDGISQGIEKFGEHLFPYLYLIHNPCFLTLQKEERLATIVAQEKLRYNRYLQSLKMFNKNLGGNR